MESGLNMNKNLMDIDFVEMFNIITKDVHKGTRCFILCFIWREG